jgi:dihydrofolate reductase
MRKLILGLAVSLDSFIEGPNGEYDWCFTDQDYGMSDFFTRTDSIFIGRKSYELLQSMSDPLPGMPAMKTYVFSNTLKEVKQGDEIIAGDIVKKVNEIRNEPGKDIWLFGGAALTTSLMNGKLVDEVWLSVHPILLGSGKPLFTGITDRIQLALKESRNYSTGLVSLTYDVVK